MITAPLIFDNNTTIINTNEINVGMLININDNNINYSIFNQCVIKIEAEINHNNKIIYIKENWFLCKINYKNLKALINYNHIIILNI